MNIICPHCGNKQKISMRLFYDLRCRACNEKMDRNKSKLYTFLKILIRVAVLLLWYRLMDFAEPISEHLGINFWIIFVALFLLGFIFICTVELIIIKISYLMNKKK